MTCCCFSPLHACGTRPPHPHACLAPISHLAPTSRPPSRGLHLHPCVWPGEASCAHDQSAAAVLRHHPDRRILLDARLPSRRACPVPSHPQWPFNPRDAGPVRHRGSNPRPCVATNAFRSAFGSCDSRACCCDHRLDDDLARHRDMWHAVVLPRLHAFASAVHRFRDCPRLRFAFLCTTADGRAAILRRECPTLFGT